MKPFLRSVIGLAGLVLPLVASGQVTTLVPSNSVSLSYVPTGVAASGSEVVVASSSDNYNYTSGLTTGTPLGFGNSSRVIDLGRSGGGANSVELNSDGIVKVYPMTDLTSAHGYTVRRLAGSSAEWGVSNSFTVGATEYVFVGYTAGSTQAVGLLNLTAPAFTALFTFSAATTPTGLGNFTLVGGTTLDDQRVMVTTDTNQVIEFNPSGSQTGNYQWFNLGASVQDISYSNGKLFVVADDLSLASVNFTIPAIPEPSTYALFAGLASLVVVVHRRRRGR